MAKRRMIARRLAYSKKANAISIKAQVVFDRTLPFLDDYGCYSADAEDVKATVFPINKKISVTNIANSLEEMKNIGLIYLYCVKGKAYQQYLNFEEFQTFRKDRERVSEYPKYNPENGGCPTTDIPMTTNDSPKLSKVKLSKYTEDFEIFWKAFKGRWNPDKGRFDKGGKMEASEVWEMLSVEQQNLAMEAAPKTGSKITKDACRWLKYHRWEDFEVSPKPEKTKQQLSEAKIKVVTKQEKVELRKKLPADIQARLKARETTRKESVGQ